jgi:hypothetical protein
MHIEKNNPKTGLLLLVIGAVAALRVATNFSSSLEPIALFTPIGAMALFGGAYFPGYAKPLLFPIITLFISDLFLSFTVYSTYRSGLLYTGWYWTYAAFALMTLVGKLIIRELRIKNLIFAIGASVLIHWLVSDMGACAGQESLRAFLRLYSQRLLTAIPFELRFLAGTLIYSGIMFGTVEWGRGWDWGSRKPERRIH